MITLAEIFIYLSLSLSLAKSKIKAGRLKEKPPNFSFPASYPNDVMPQNIHISRLNCWGVGKKEWVEFPISPPKTVEIGLPWCGNDGAASAFSRH